MKNLFMRADDMTDEFIIRNWIWSVIDEIYLQEDFLFSCYQFHFHNHINSVLQMVRK